MSNDSPQSTLALFTDKRVKATGERLLAIQKATVQSVQLIRRMESEAALRAILVGSQLYVIKTSLEHGKWGPWQAENLDGIGQRQSNYYMKLAGVFAAKSGIKPSELADVLAETDAWNRKSALSAPAKRFVKKATEFVGDESLTDLLIRENVRSVGLRKELDAPKGKKESAKAKAKRLRAQLWDDTFQNINWLDETLTKPERVELLDDPQRLAEMEEHFTKLKTAARKRRKQLSETLDV